MKKILITTILSVAALSFSCEIRKSERSSANGLVGENSGIVQGEATKELFWAHEAVDNKHCYFVSKVSFDGNDNLKDVLETQIVNQYPVDKSQLLQAVSEEPQVTNGDVFKAGVSDAIGTAISIVPLALMFYNHPGIQGVPEVLARILPSVFVYGSGISFYLGGGAVDYEKNRKVEVKEATESLNSKSVSDDINELKSKADLTRAESSVLKNAFERLQNGTQVSEEKTCKSILDAK